MERLVMYETLVGQVVTLGSLGPVSTVRIHVRARLFWYSHLVEGVTTGLRGGRLFM
jgi:hypothetical protein